MKSAGEKLRLLPPFSGRWRVGGKEAKGFGNSGGFRAQNSVYVCVKEREETVFPAMIGGCIQSI